MSEDNQDFETIKEAYEQGVIDGHAANGNALDPVVGCELLPCPCCGDPELFDCDNGNDGWYIMCSSCGVNVNGDNRPECKSAWNTRQKAKPNMEVTGR